MESVPTIGALLERRALIDRDTLGLVAGDLRLSFGELRDWAAALADALAVAGIGHGDRVAVLSRNSAELVALYYATARLGAIYCPLNIRLTEDELAYILSDAEPALLAVHPDLAATAQALAYRAGIGTVWTFGQPPMAQPPSWSPTLDVRVAAGALNNQAPVSCTDPLLLVYTSGTTGKPKGAVLSHSSMYWVSATMTYSLDYRYRDSGMIPVPMFHVGGMSFVTFFVHMGATAILPPAWVPEEILRLIETEKVNHFFAVAAMLQSLLDDPRFTETDLSSLRWILAGGAPVPPALIRRFGEIGIPVQQTFGSTETAGPATYVDLAHVGAKAESVGLPFFHTDLRVVGPDGTQRVAGATGEIEVRAPHLFVGYWRDPEATASAFTKDGWYRTGDIGQIDEDGYLYIRGRKKDVIISGGENVYPAEVEEVLAQHPAIAEVAVVALTDEKWGEIPCAVLRPKPGAPAPDQNAVAAFCADKLARYKIPKRVEVMEEPLPRTATGKLLKHVLRDRLRARS